MLGGIMGLMDTFHFVPVDLKGASDALTQRTAQSAPCSYDLKGASEGLTQMEQDHTGQDDFLFRAEATPEFHAVDLI